MIRQAEMVPFRHCAVIPGGRFATRPRAREVLREFDVLVSVFPDGGSGVAIQLSDDPCQRKRQIARLKKLLGDTFRVAEGSNKPAVAPAPSEVN